MHVNTITIALDPKVLTLLESIDGKLATLISSNREENANTRQSEEQAENSSVSTSEVRSVALQLSKSGKRDVIKSIFERYGASKLQEIDEKHYPELLEALKGEL